MSTPRTGTFRAVLPALAALGLATLPVVAVLRGEATLLQPSAALLLAVAVPGLLAPLFWPGRAATPLASAARVLGWSLGVAVLGAAAALSGAARGAGLHTLLRAVALLLVLSALIHAALAALEQGLRNAGLAHDSARDGAVWLGCAALVAAGAAPLWLGPAAELASGAWPRAVDAVVAASPLTHLAVASDNDLLRNQWFYQHSNLAGLRFQYPSLAAVFTTLSVATLALLLLPVLLAGRRAPPPCTTEEAGT